MTKTLQLMTTATALATLLALGAQDAAAATLATSATAVAAPAPHLVKGFRSAAFGMTEAEVKAAIARDFKPAADALTAFDNPVEKTHAIALHLAALDPAPGAVNISYIFGTTTHRLIHVNVVWSSGPTPTDTERLQMATASTQLAAYFHDLSWQRGATTSSVAPDGAYAIVFAGVDPKDAAVEVRVSGVEIRRTNRAPTVPAGPAVLRVAYYATTGKPDTASAVRTGGF
jgi:hypothetical protein